jgi:hypothetical protein
MSCTNECTYSSRVFMLGSFCLSIPKDADIISTIHNPLVAGLRIGQPAAKMLLLNKFFLFWLNVLIANRSILFDICESVNCKNVRLVHAMTVKGLDGSDCGFRVFEINKAISTNFFSQKFRFVIHEFSVISRILYPLLTRFPSSLFSTGIKIPFSLMGPAAFVINFFKTVSNFSSLL